MSVGVIVSSGGLETDSRVSGKYVCLLVLGKNFIHHFTYCINPVMIFSPRLERLAKSFALAKPISGMDWMTLC